MYINSMTLANVYIKCKTCDWIAILPRLDITSLKAGEVLEHGKCGVINCDGIIIIENIEYFVE